MGVTAAVAAITVAAGSTFVSANNAAHAKTDANTAAVGAQDAANKQIQAAQTQQTQNLDNQATATSAAQARVRAISNPGGDTIMTSPLGATGGQSSSTNLNAPSPSPGSQVVTGKTVLGG